MGDIVRFNLSFHHTERIQAEAIRRLQRGNHKNVP